MSKGTEIIKYNRDELSNIFPTENDKNGTDLLSMSDFFNVFIGQSESKIETDVTWELAINIEGLFGKIAAAINSGFDISQMDMLVADHSHFSQEIIDGLKKGIYHVGQSREVAGNLRPAILDKDEHLVKFFTLRKAINPSEVLADISTLAMQTSLQRISYQIESVEKSVKGINDFVRRVELSNKFINARDKVLSASSASPEDSELYLKEADTYLMEGLTNLYSDINAQVKRLLGIKGPFASVKEIDEVLSYINEDMMMIPRYVGVRAYLLNYRGKLDDANRVLGEYKYQLKSLSERKMEGSGDTALEIIHKNYPYSKTDVDFWLEKPKQMLEVIDSCEKMLTQHDKNIFLIDAEDSKNE